MLGTISGVENVSAAVPLVRMRIIANAQPALLIGLGQNASELHSDLQTAIQDQLDSGSPVTSAPNGVIVGGGLGVAKGTQFDVAGSTQVTAVAVVDGPAARRLNDAHFVIAPLALAQRISGREQRLDSILLFTNPLADVAEVRSAVTTALDGRAVVATPSFRAAQASSSFAILQAMTLLAASVSLVVAALPRHLDDARARRSPAHDHVRHARRSCAGGLPRGRDRIGARDRDRLPRDRGTAVDDGADTGCPPRVRPAAVGRAACRRGVRRRQRERVGDGRAAGPRGGSDRGVGARRGGDRGDGFATTQEHRRGCRSDPARCHRNRRHQRSGTACHCLDSVVVHRGCGPTRRASPRHRPYPGRGGRRRRTRRRRRRQRS